jgi:hypothetical protein
MKRLEAKNLVYLFIYFINIFTGKNDTEQEIEENIKQQNEIEE